MQNPFKPGDTKVFTHTVSEADSATFESGQVYAVYSTFALTRDAEWSGRLFVLDMKESGEEGIGTGITIHHISPALIGQQVTFTATFLEINGNEIVTNFVAKVGSRIVADGTQWQKVINKSKFDKLLESLR